MNPSMRSKNKPAKDNLSDNKLLADVSFYLHNLTQYNGSTGRRRGQIFFYLILSTCVSRALSGSFHYFICRLKKKFDPSERSFLKSVLRVKTREVALKGDN